MKPIHGGPAFQRELSLDLGDFEVDTFSSFVTFLRWFLRLGGDQYLQGGLVMMAELKQKQKPALSLIIKMKLLF